MKYTSILLVTLLLSVSCSESDSDKFEFSGGSISFALDNQPSTFIPREITDFYSATVFGQVVEGLVSIDPKTTKIVPRLATEWVKSPDGKSYTFTIREGVLFHPHPVFKSEEDRILTTEDIIKTFEKGCTVNSKGMEPNAYSMSCKTLLKGAKEFYEEETNSISGVKVEGNKVTFELLYEDHNFLFKLASINMAIVSSKIIAAGNETDVIGTGPFIYSEKLNKGGEVPRLTLLRNEDYYLKDDAGFSLPYLDSLNFIFQSRKHEQLDMFKAGETDLIFSLPTSRITMMLEGSMDEFNSVPPKLIMNNNALLETDYYFFNMKDERFKDPRVRKAFNYAFNKKKVGIEILRNQFYDLGYYGITPPVSKALKGYDFKSIKEVGYEYNPEMARKLLAEAGYPNGEGFGSIQLRYNINDKHSAVADEFAKSIYSVLGINVNIDGSTFEQLITDQENGNGDIFRLGWSADYPNPESFLVSFYSKSIPEDENSPSMINKARYKNVLFDQFYEMAIDSKKMSDQMSYFSKAEVELMKDPPIIPIWYSGDICLMRSKVRDFHFNALNYLDFTSVYIKEWTKEEYQKKYIAEK